MGLTFVAWLVDELAVFDVTVRFCDGLWLAMTLWCTRTGCRTRDNLYLCPVVVTVATLKTYWNFLGQVQLFFFEAEAGLTDRPSVRFIDPGAPLLTQLHRDLIDDIIDDELAINTHYAPLRQMDRTSDREGGWHDLVASLAERYASGSKAIQPHIAEDKNERPLDPSLFSTIENITRLPTHNRYPFWRVRCKVTDWCLPH